MKITTQDGRSFSGTPLQIVKQMQSLSFGQQKAPLQHYVHWVVSNAARTDNVALRVSGANDDALCASLLAELQSAGLARTEDDGATPLPTE